ALCRSFLCEGILPAAAAFARGFAYFAPAGTLALRIFSLVELRDLLCGGDVMSRDELWAPDAVLHCIRTDHGYSPTSAPVRALLEVLHEFSAAERRLFMRFITGAPRLPSGGFGALQPPLTIVRTAAHDREEADALLPTCSTCHVYLKLPAYSSKTQLRAKLLLAIREGQEVFAFD
ncbi:hypothetical protein EON67_08115, partial [archaeon]